MKAFLFLTLLVLGCNCCMAQTLADRMKAVPVDALQGRVGVGVLDLQTGESWYRQGQRAFPMQSVFKLPLAIAVLKQVDAGKFSLDQKVTVTPADFAPAWSPLRDKFKGESAEYTVRELITLAMSISDNTAADVLLKLVGGAHQVTSDIGIRDIRVDRSESELQPESVGLGAFKPEFASPAVFEDAIKALPAEVKKTAVEKYLNDPRDTATPEAMVELLGRLYQGKLLSAGSTDFLLGIMKDTFTGQNRLRAGLPKGWALAHKTGTGIEILGISTAANNVGIAIGPDKHAVVIAVFVAGSRADEAARDKLIADFAAAATR